jgi:type II secretory pathway component GspD/PulD (secretin)
MRLKKLTIAITFAALSGCANQFEFSQEDRYGDLTPGREAKMQAMRGNTFVREIRTEDVAGQRPIFLTAQNKSLRSVLQETLPGYSIIPRGSVNLNDPIDVAARGMTLNDFIEYIEGTRDLEIKLDGKRVYITDFETREWNLATFATSRNIDSLITSKQSSGAKAGDDDSDTASDKTTGSTIAVNLSEDEWVKIMEGARRIIGAQDPTRSAGPQSAPAAADSTSVGSGATAASSAQTMPDGSPLVGLNFGPAVEQLDRALTAPDPREPYIEGIRSVGIVTAGGRPSKLRILDRYLKKAVSEATKIVNVQVEAYDVVLNNGKQKGIDWSVLKPGTLNGNLLDFTLSNTSEILGTGGFWNIAGSYQGDRGEANAFIRFLETFGRVELQDQPNITVRNGVPAQIYAGEELTYIVDVEQSQDESGNVTVTPKLGRLKVGVTLAVTVRVLEDERLLVDVTPVISNLNGFDQISVGTTSFDTPRVALKEFSTQLITTSGQPVHLGGLITERVEKALERLPWQNVVTRSVVNPFTQNLNNALERRELVLVVTPTLIEGAN